tara:strand:- start:879 stop:1046 length:168 start_codon:yes stop_codon:yes gene_type:complete
MKVGSLVKYKNGCPRCRKGLVVEVKGRKWIKVFWTTKGFGGGLIFLEHAEDLIFL